MKKERIEIVEGMYLATRNGNVYTNAIVTKVDGDDVTVLTDFGNFLSFTKQEVRNHFNPSKAWLEAMKWEYPLPTITQRIDEQILKLQSAKQELNQGEK